MGAILAPLPRTGDNIGPDGREFSWGPIVKVHEVGVYQFVEFLRDYSRTSSTRDLSEEHGKPAFSVYIRGRDTHVSADTIEEAMAIAMSYRFDGPNSQAAHFFMKMIGYEEHSHYKPRDNG